MESDMEKLMEHFFGNLISRENECDCVSDCVWVSECMRACVSVCVHERKKQGLETRAYVCACNWDCLRECEKKSVPVCKSDYLRF